MSYSVNAELALSLAAEKLRHRDLKPKQDVVKTFLEGNDIFAARPTGCGKSPFSLRQWSRMFSPHMLQSLAGLSIACARKQSWHMWVITSMSNFCSKDFTAQ